jgi:hypothetical protein
MEEEVRTTNWKVGTKPLVAIQIKIAKTVVGQPEA